MKLKRIAMSAVFVAGLAALPYSAAKAQTPYYAFPPAWPIIALGAIIGDTATALAPHPAPRRPAPTGERQSRRRSSPTPARGARAPRPGRSPRLESG